MVTQSAVQEARPSRSAFAILRQVLGEVRGFRSHLVAIALCGVVAAPLAVLPPLAMMVFVDGYVGQRPLPSALAWLWPGGLQNQKSALGVAIVLVLGGAMLTQALNFGRKLLRTYTKEKVVLRLRGRLFGHVERLSLSYHDDKGPSQASFRVLMDTAVIPSILLDGLIPMAQSAAVVCVIGSILLTLSPQMALVALAVVPLLLLVSWPFGKRLRQQWHEVKQVDTEALGLLQEVFSAVRVVKVFGKEERETSRLDALGRRGMAARLRVTKTQGWFSALLAIATAIGTAAFMVVGAWQLDAGALTLGQLALVAALMIQFYSPLQQLVGTVASLQSALASAERCLALLDEAPDVAERADARSMQRATGGIRFEDVGFSYDSGRPVLRSISFEVLPGEKIGIAGHTGAGKSTLMNLLMRLHDVGSGRILLDGHDLRDLKIDDLRQQFAVVLQEPVLFNKSIADNINYALPGASREQTVQAAQQANAHDFILAMPAGYDTIPGERGMRMSGGERQRISLARAFLKDAPILILDEPTSSVDMRTEAVIMEASQRLMQGRTTFIIAHRPSTLEVCDKVLVLDKGRVVAFARPGDVTSLTALMLTESA